MPNYLNINLTMHHNTFNVIINKKFIICLQRCIDCFEHTVIGKYLNFYKLISIRLFRNLFTTDFNMSYSY